MKRTALRVVTGTILATLTVALAGCGNTMYGLGLDMERVGQRFQRQHNPQGGDYYYGSGGQGYGGQGYGGGGQTYGGGYGY